MNTSRGNRPRRYRWLSEFPLAVVAYKITQSGAISLAIAGGAAAVFLAAWYVYPFLARA